jgi:hypothetical protein
VLNEEPVCESVGVGDAAADTGFISCMDYQPIATGFVLDVYSSFVEPKFMPKYEVAFGDERVENSVDDQSFPKLSKRGQGFVTVSIGGTCS